MSQYIKLLQHNGGFISVLADDNGVIQYTTNDADFSDIEAASTFDGVTTDVTLAGDGKVTPLTVTLSAKRGANLTDADQTLQPFTAKASQYVQVTPLTADRVKTLGTTTVRTGTCVRIVRADTAAHTLTITNGGTNGGSQVFAASPTEVQAMTFQYNSVDWVFLGFEYLTAVS